MILHNLPFCIYGHKCGRETSGRTNNEQLYTIRPQKDGRMKSNKYDDQNGEEYWCNYRATGYLTAVPPVFDDEQRTKAGALDGVVHHLILLRVDQ